MLNTLDRLGNTPLVYILLVTLAVIYVLRDPTMIASLRALIALIDTNSGYILVLSMFVWFGWHVFAIDPTAGGQIITGAWAALLVLLNVRRSQQPGTTTVETSAIPPAVPPQVTVVTPVPDPDPTVVPVPPPGV